MPDSASQSRPASGLQTGARRGRARRRRWPLLLLLAAMLLGAAEVAFRVQPTLLPLWYREQFPVRGIEFSHPGLLARTPTEGYPIPGPQQSYTGPPPAGLVAPTRLVDPAVNPDLLRYPQVSLTVDSNGFPNLAIPERADVLFVGDSFTVSAGAQDPPGLQPLLAAATGLSVYNLGIAGIGPARERWLMQHYGLPLHPRAVVWFFFGGNDLTDIEKMQLDLDAGRLTFDQHTKYEPLPFSRALDLVWRWFDFGPERLPDDPPLTRGVHLTHGPDAGVDTWFAPIYLRNLLLDRKSLREHPGMTPALTELSAAHAELTAAGIPLLLVYLPSKPEVMLPFVADQLDQLWPMVIYNLRAESPMTPQEYLATALAHRDTLEQLMREFAERRGLAFLSATPALTRLTEEGRLGFLSADTHWNEAGQAALLPELVAALKGLGVK